MTAIKSKTLTIIEISPKITGTDFVNFLMERTGADITWRYVSRDSELTLVEIKGSSRACATGATTVHGNGYSLAEAADEMLKSIAKHKMEFTVKNKEGITINFMVKIVPN